MGKNLVLVTLVGLLVLVGAARFVSADDAVPAGTLPALDWSQNAWTGAGEPLPQTSASVDAVKAGDLHYLWSFEGNVGTYVDGCTTIELVPTADAYDVKMLTNCLVKTLPGATDACLIAQVKLGSLTTFDEVDAACADLPSASDAGQ